MTAMTVLQKYYDIGAAQRGLDRVADTITHFQALGSPTSNNVFLAQSSGLVKSGAQALDELGHTKLAEKLTRDASALDGAFVSKVGPGPTPTNLSNIRDRILEGVRLLHTDMSKLDIS
ncbi:MAG: hypothetical protein JWM25_928 [Thermoleophilia bacterium]|nr:hypothetical protein [Thermoleophilia bacterium]